MKMGWNFEKITNSWTSNFDWWIFFSFWVSLDFLHYSLLYMILINDMSPTDFKKEGIFYILEIFVIFIQKPLYF